MSEIKHWPAFRYHKEFGGKVFDNQAELDAAGDGWRKEPYTYRDEVTGEFKPIPGADDGPQHESPKRKAGRPPKKASK